MENKEYLDLYRHSAAHVMAHAVKRLFPEVKLGIGPPIEDGFYYDFDLPQTLTPELFSRIEEEMEKIIIADYPFVREELSYEEAKSLLLKDKEDYKLELLEGFRDDTLSIYRSGDFFDLCRGPHLESTGKIKAFKLLSVAGAYWKGDEQRPMLQRIYATAFPDKKALRKHLAAIEEAKKRDHRKLGREMDLFSFHEEAPGAPFFHPLGVVLYNNLLEFWRKIHSAHGYEEVMTPLILKDELWHQSGHWEHYKDHMYLSTVGEQGYAVKPMNCPGTLLLYKENQHSYREFPLKIAELGRVHRLEMTGVLHGLFRVQSFIIDDAHIFCLPEQIKEEIEKVAELILDIYRQVGFTEYQIEISTRPEKSIGSDEDWELATRSLMEALDEKKIEYTVSEGEGAFYGPKIDFHIKDCLKRTHQCGTIQLDFSMPRRFELEYVGSDGEKHRPVMIHRAAFGSIERFLAILLEHYGGMLPLWLAPVQAIVLPISEKFSRYAGEVNAALKKAGIRVELDIRNEKIGYKIRAARIRKIPYMLVVGSAEAEAGTVAVRKLKEGQMGEWKIQDFIDEILDGEDKRH
ncbi:MAG: threonine--tRNA ligase [Candidatus Auribacterota bacterium]|nr:threonine--tRNA ligase [Candidatus Auribacterota bacterium]